MAGTQRIKSTPNRAVPTEGPMVVLGGSDGRGWDVETRETDDQPAVLVGRFNSLGDAKLFAAAGEMLDACEQTLDDMDRYMSDQKAWVENRDQLRAAILKAKGGAKMKRITLAEYNAIHPDFRGIWTTERDDMPNWAQDREQYMGKRTMMSGDGKCCLLIEGMHFEVVEKGGAA